MPRMRLGMLLAPALIGLSACVTTPPPHSELVPPPPPGAGAVVWQPGHWLFTGAPGRDWSWQPGQYVPPPMGQTTWVPGRWQQQPTGGWSWLEGHWA